MSENFDRLFDLAKKSGSRLIVCDPQGGQHLAILGIDDFEQLLSSGGEALSTPSFSAPTQPVVAKELPAPAPTEPIVNDEEPLYYEEIPQEQEDEPVTPPSSPEPSEPEEKAEADVQSEPVPELELEIEPAPESESEKELGAETEAETSQKSELAAENPQELPVDGSAATLSTALPSSRDWHRLGDVLRQVHPEIGQVTGKTPVPYQEHPDEPGESEGTNEPESPVFLEEPLE